MASLVNQNWGVRAGVVGGILGSPYFFRQILSDMDTISQWHKFKFQNRGEMMHPTMHANALAFTKSLLHLSERDQTIATRKFWIMAIVFVATWMVFAIVLEITQVSLAIFK